MSAPAPSAPLIRPPRPSPPRHPRLPRPCRVVGRVVERAGNALPHPFWLFWILVRGSSP